MTKKKLLGISALYVVLVIAGYFITVYSEFRIRDNDPIGVMLTIFSPLIFTFVFSLITYRMREEAFRAWWGFAKWFAPIIALVTYLQNSGSHSGGMGISGAIGGSFDMFVLIVLYMILVGVSVMKIKAVYKVEINNFLESISYQSTRKYVLIASALSSAIFVYASLVLRRYFGYYGSYYEDFYGAAIYLFFPMPLIFIISLLIYNFDIKVFQAWWRFAKWFVPLIVFISMILDNDSSRDGVKTIGDYVDLRYLGISYAILFGVSAVKSWKAYKSGKI